VVGLLGWGHIARHFARLLEPFGCTVLVWSESAQPDELVAAGARPASLAEILQSAKVVSVHRGLTDETRGFLDARALAQLQPGAVLVNTARGPLVDEAALVARLQRGDVVAALDVFDEEPLDSKHPLRSLPNAILTPHNASTHVAGGCAHGPAGAAHGAGLARWCRRARDRRSTSRPHDLMTDLATQRIGFKPYSYDDAVPSVRLRTKLPIDALREAGLHVTTVPPDGTGEYDCVVFQKAYTAQDLGLARRLADGGTKLVFDLCDNHFYDGGDPTLAERAARLREMVAMVDAVSVSMPLLAELVDSTPTFVVDDALEVPPFTAFDRAAVAARRLAGRVRPRLGLVWFGHHGELDPPFGMVHLGALVPELERLDRDLPLRLTVISNSRGAFDDLVAHASFPTRYVSWSARTFARHFLANDVCVLPIAPNPVTLYKTNNRVRTALLLGLPVVTDEIPAYEEFADWLRFDDWAASITAYASDPRLGKQHVEQARAHIAATYTAGHLVEQWCDVLRAVLACA